MRMIPSQANEPTGFASPLRAMSVPIIVVVVTAPNPTHITPSLPLAGFTISSFIIEINFNQFLKSGFASKIQTIHRETIDKATKRKKKRKEAN
jgi:hypothetical protein